jgi:hypothetical protein
MKFKCGKNAIAVTECWNMDFLMKVMNTPMGGFIETNIDAMSVRKAARLIWAYKTNLLRTEIKP